MPLDALPSALPAWHRDDRGPWYRLQALDRSLIGAPALYLAASEGVGWPPYAPWIDLRADDWLGGGTLRQSFYAEPWAQLTHAGELGLVIEAQGHLRVRVMGAAPGRPPVCVQQRTLDASERSRHVLPLGPLSALPPATRLFWHLDAIDGARLHEAAWCTRTAPRPQAGLAVLMRTWGRSADLRAQLERLADGAQHDPWHEALLRRTRFHVLDTSADAEAHWHDAAALGLALQVHTGPNLGGGGNASHLLHRFLQGVARDEAAGAAVPDEVLILDDDLLLSMESLSRYWMHAALRRGDHVCSLPVLMKSAPTRVWEDGGHWGRSPATGALDAGGPPPERHLSPTLHRHGLALDGFEHLDAFAPLNRCEYTTFIFFGLPLSAVRRLGLPAAFFLRGDDIEYSLRARAAGLPVVTLPHLAAWHEPGHSHAQEYQAILHGVLINLTYAAPRPDALAAWFERRLAEHAAIDDLAGIALYQAVLDALCDTDGELLTPAFDAHYRRVLPQVAGPAMEPLSAADFERLLQGGPPDDLAVRPFPTVRPFLYPGMPDPHAPRRATVLVNHGARSARALPAVAPAQRLAAMQRYLDRLAEFVQRFDALQAHWVARLQDSGRPAFWAQVAERQAGRTRLLLDAPFRLRARPPEEPATPPGDTAAPAAVPVRELRQRLERDLAELARLRRAQAGAPAGPRPPARGASALHRLARRLGDALARVTAAPGHRPRRAAPPATPLPADFDPAQYLALNQDVARTGVDPVTHYRRYGRAEGRRYRT
ncbi:MAG: glycosyltransferase [Burkholderiales bacterium]|nr:glycosyltransferase [Burkholderiales bacterium]